MSMKDKKTPFCKVPFLIGYTTGNNQYRDCCSKRPRLCSDPGQDFQEWWKSDELNQFRRELMETMEHPPGCSTCAIAEKYEGNNFTSLRTAINKWDNTDYAHPAGWNIIFGNTCNLACWSCNENSSSVIFQHKKKAGLVSGKDPAGSNFEKFWPDLRKNILKSYEHHETVNLTLLGGEPLYNKIVIDFLQHLVDMNLAGRTRLEFHTNGTVYPYKIFPRDKKSPWQHVCMFISLDATGPYAEWLRYGCNWSKVDTVVDSLIASSDYIEIQCTLTVLNVNQLQELSSYAESKNVRLRISKTDEPDFMALKNWDLPKESLLVNKQYDQFQIYYDLIGTTPKTGSSDRLKDYIRKFDGIRKPLSDFDKVFANKLGW
jgi:organic radical activating enzyme